MEIYFSAHCYECDTDFKNNEIDQPLSETFLKKVFYETKQISYYRCPVCRSEDGMEMYEANEQGQFWVVADKLMRAPDGVTRRYSNWTPFMSYKSALAEWEMNRDLAKTSASATLVKVYQDYDKEIPEADVPNISNC